MLTESRLARNPALSRSLNNRVVKIAQTSETFGGLSFMCECGIYACRERVQMTVPEYAGIRLQPSHFLVCPDHVIEVVDSVVADCDRYTVVDNVGDGSEEADGADTSALLASLRA